MPRYTQREFEKWIIDEDQDILILHKPSGIAVQSASVAAMDLENLAKAYLKGGYVGVVHRLDQPVEGLILFAKNKKAASFLDRQIAKGEMKKEYIALCADCQDPSMRKERSTLEDYLLRDGRNHTSMVVPKGTPGAKRALLEYDVIKRAEKPDPRALLHIRLMTGRYHQIRVQLSHIGLPILGDTRYGETGCAPESGAMALCAAALSFIHPGTGQKVQEVMIPQNDVFLPFLDIIKTEMAKGKGISGS